MDWIVISGGILNIVAAGVYFYGMRRDTSHPNPASWFIWSFIAFLNVISWSEMSQGGASASFQLWVNASVVFLITLYALVAGKFSKLTKYEIIILILGILATLFWWVFKSAIGANIIIITAYILSYIPTFKTVYRDVNKESPLPWTLWGMAFLMSAVYCLSELNYLACMNPLILALLHFTVGALSCKSCRYG